MQIVNVEMDQIEVVLLVEHALDQKHMMRQRVDTTWSQSKRLLTYGHQMGLGERVAAGKKSHIMSLPYEFFGEIGNYPFGSAIEFWRNAFVEWRNLGNSHNRSVLSVRLTNAQSAPDMNSIPDYGGNGSCHLSGLICIPQLEPDYPGDLELSSLMGCLNCSR